MEKKKHVAHVLDTWLVDCFSSLVTRSFSLSFWLKSGPKWGWSDMTVSSESWLPHI